MSVLVKGGNGFVPSVPLRIDVSGGVDTMALLLTDGGAVRGDGDVVFHGAPTHPSGTVRLTGGPGGTAWLEADLPGVEAQIARVLVVGSTEHGALRDVRGLSVEAFAPDGTSVARYDVTDAAGETAMVLAELYRRAGGWKFRAVGQGYVNGLVGLATDHGVDVAEAQQRAGGGAVPVTPVVPAAPVVPAGPVPGFAPPPDVTVPVGAPAVVTPSAAAGAGGAWAYGPVFAPYTKIGRNNDVITVDGLPPGPVVVQLDVQGDGYTALTTLDRRNKEQDNLVNSTEDDFRGRVLATVPANRPLRLKLEAEGPWRVEVSPLAAARRLTEDEAEFRGPDVLLHTGGVADLAVRYRGDDNLIVNIYELDGHGDPTALPEDENVINEIGERSETVPLPEGPLVVQFEMADGPWRARLKRVQPLSRPMPAPGAAREGVAPHPFADPGKDDTVAWPPGTGGISGWLSRGRRDR
ncbi:resistance protein [Streptomyces venezuelae]|uniref:TerD family protein n=1 Tax=Streptomyces venezuelae TaxID=54571 RepID=UPI00123D68A7|nr:TerD family protein [Streptomyces venezuelae]QES16644.1 resistance protein [Streptomyces venezuelae]